MDVPLSGRNLIEASAGTGKTHALACLYLRLLIEKGLTPEQILVVTYTEAATEELRGRIRARIREAHEVFCGGKTDDLFFRKLRDRADESGVLIARSRLNSALNSFDLATIFTIHGFCLRALEDNAFESGSLYDTELLTDQTELLQEIVDDFWRAKFFKDPAPLIGYALRNRFTPECCAGLLAGMLGNPKMTILPAFDEEEIPAIEKECLDAFVVVKAEWEKNESGIVNLLQSDRGLSRAAEHYKSELLPALVERMHAFTSGSNPFELFCGFDKFTASGIVHGTKPSGAAPEHPFFGLCEELQKKIEKRFLALRWELIAYARERLPSRKREINIRFFDDLLSDLFEALHSKGGGRLGESLRRKHRAALIDEFQDTDPVQYDIFSMIYTGPDCPLFLIGDPKQAIYSFRGADIFAYLEAKAEVDPERRFTLTHNWRSTPSLLAAFNTVFENVDRPFLFDGIAYCPVRSGKGDAAGGFDMVRGDQAPLQVWLVPADHDGKDLSVGKAGMLIASSVAAEIARLLQDGSAMIGSRAVLPEDIAVIVRTHTQAVYIQDALRGIGIPSVMASDKSIFVTDEARDVCTLLAALADPRNESKVRAALVSDILGRTGDDIAVLLEDEQAWEECMERFRAYHQRWRELGFMVMVQALLAGEGIRGRLLRRPDGERRLTNLLHCFEIIHNAAQERRLGVEGLVTWFGERVSREESAEEYQIRLETDEKAVKIVTVHLSKGLEYPIVFCPYLWGGVRPGEKVLTFHDRFKMVRDFGSPDYDRHRAIAQKEGLAENLRLLYVALTRAKFRCYLVGGKIVDKTGKNRPETSALSYLFHASAEARAAEDVISSIAQEVKALPAREMREQISSLAARANGTISALGMPEPTGAAPYVLAMDEGEGLECREFGGMIDSSWRVASFTSLAAHDAPSAELPDRDETAMEEAPDTSAAVAGEPQPRNMFAFPRGARAGIFLHEIFERLDFATETADPAEVERCLMKHGFGAEWKPLVCDMISNVLRARLPSPPGEFTLADLKRGSWISELEFYLPLQFITSEKLKACFQQWRRRYEAADLSRLCSTLNFRPVKGMIRGFIDLVFEHRGRYYLVDWKSNHLGSHSEDYGKEALKAVMERKRYPLQYLLYTVALNRYLSLRVPNFDYSKQFGGVLYVFLRGIDAGRGDGTGVFRDVPPLEIIRGLTSCLVEAGG